MTNTPRPAVVCPVCGKRYENPGPLVICIGDTKRGTTNGTHDPVEAR